MIMVLGAGILVCVSGRLAIYLCMHIYYMYILYIYFVVGHREKLRTREALVWLEILCAKLALCFCVALRKRFVGVVRE